MAKETEPKPVTYRVDIEIMERVKDFAWWERRTITSVVNEALAEYLKDKKFKSREKR